MAVLIVRARERFHCGHVMLPNFSSAYISNTISKAIHAWLMRKSSRYRVDIGRGSDDGLRTPPPPFSVTECFAAQLHMLNANESDSFEKGVGFAKMFKNWRDLISGHGCSPGGCTRSIIVCCHDTNSGLT